MPEPLPPLPLTPEQAIARMEGWYASGPLNRPQRCNNPGDIEFGEFSRKFGATHGDPRFAVFPTPEAGWACLHALLRTEGYQNLTVAQMVHRYAPAFENDTDLYTLAVCHWCGCKAEDRLDSVLNRETV